MARDDHSRARHVSALRRKKPTRPPYDRILVVCEGKKTEPNYFEEIRMEARIPAIHVYVLPSGFGTQPSRVVEFAVATFKETKGFEKVFAVFDRDDHPSYVDAVKRVESLDGKLKNDENEHVVFKAIVSVPSFELWLLLHYVDIQAFHHRDIVLHRLRAYIPNYEKGNDGLYTLTQGMLPIATKRAEHLRTRFSRLPGEEAYTDVDELVSVLRSLTRVT
jgi:hypothetical protein